MTIDDDGTCPICGEEYVNKYSIGEHEPRPSVRSDFETCAVMENLVGRKAIYVHDPDAPRRNNYRVVHS